MNLQENIRRVLKEETLKSILIDMIKTEGWKSVQKYVGDEQDLKNVTEIHNSVVFLNLFSDLDHVESEETQGLFLFRYEKGKNVMVFEESDNGIYVYINYDIIFGPLANFRETVRYDEKMQTIKRWLTRAYGVETKNIIHIDSFHPGSEEFGVYETLI